jgi:hypothetical protein
MKRIELETPRIGAIGSGPLLLFLQAEFPGQILDIRKQFRRVEGDRIRDLIIEVTDEADETAIRAAVASFTAGS